MSYSVNDITYALTNLGDAVAAGEVIAGSDLRAGNPVIGPFGVVNGIPAYPAFPVVVGAALEGTWRSLAALPSAIQWNELGTYAVGGYFRRIA